MFKKIIALAVLGLPLSSFADTYTSYFTNQDQSQYAVTYKQCLELNSGLNCVKWSPDTTVTVGPAPGSVVPASLKNNFNLKFISVVDEKGSSLSGAALSACTPFPSGIVTFFHLGDRVACKAGGYTKK